MNKFVLACRIHFDQGTGFCGGRHFLTVASRDPCTVERGRACATHALLKNKANKEALKQGVKAFPLKC